MDGRQSGTRDRRTPPRLAPRLELNVAAFQALRRSKGWTNRDMAADALGIGPATLSRACNHVGLMDNRTIAALLVAAKSAGMPPGVAIDTLFALVEDDGGTGGGVMSDQQAPPGFSPEQVAAFNAGRRATQNRPGA